VRAMALFLACLLSACVLSACVYVPTRQKVVKGELVTPAEAASLIQPGTPLTEVQSRLGSPTLDLRDINVAVWSWSVRKGFWFFALPTPVSAGAGAGESERGYDLMVAYAGDGRVLDHALEKRRALDNASEHARQWHQSRVAGWPQASDSPPAPAIGEIHAYVGRQCSHGTVALAVDGQRIAELGPDDHAMTRTTPGRHTVTARVGERELGVPLEVTVDATQPTYIRVCNPLGLSAAFHPRQFAELMKATFSGTIGDAESLRVVDRDAAVSEMPGLR